MSPDCLVNYTKGEMRHVGQNIYLEKVSPSHREFIIKEFYKMKRSGVWCMRGVHTGSKNKRLVNRQCWHHNDDVRPFFPCGENGEIGGNRWN